MHSHTLTRLTSYYIHGSTVSKQYSSAHVDVEFFHYYIYCWTDGRLLVSSSSHNRGWPSENGTLSRRRRAVTTATAATL